jgi:predicted nucleic acid-binding protein
MDYLDASALVKRYVRENGSLLVRRLVTAGPVATSRLSEVEVASALVRRARELAFSTRERDRALTMLAADFDALPVVELVPEVTAIARALLLRRVLRASDAIQLASCLLLQRELQVAVRFVVFDDRLREAARTEGLSLLP